MWKRKSCPRCQGDLFIDDDVGTRYVKCLQCGYEKEITNRSLNLYSLDFKKEKPGAMPA